MSNLTTVRKINARIWENVNNRGGYVYAEVPGIPEPVRITRARSVAGKLQVKTLLDGRWVTPFRVWQEQREHHEAELRAAAGVQPSSMAISEQVICESCGRLIDPDTAFVHTCLPLRVGERFQKMMDSLLGENGTSDRKS